MKGAAHISRSDEERRIAIAGLAKAVQSGKKGGLLGTV